MNRRNYRMSIVLVFGIMALLTMGSRRINKYQICHKGKGDPSTYKFMTIPWTALKGHEAHGDYIWQEEALPRFVRMA